jgi:ubiquinone/menaquinone biosynthesis C-methylase UbiE
MLAYARANSSSDGRVEYVLNECGDLARFSDNSFDFILSSITLQHIPARFIPNYLRDFVRILAPGGVMVFQLPSESANTLRGWIWRLLPKALIASALRRKNRLPVAMQMNALPRHKVEALLTSAGARISSATRDTEAGRDWISFRYVVIKP